MSFGLRNVRATYQRSIYKVFEHQIGSNIEVYFNDMAIKRKDDNTFLQDIDKALKRLRRTNTKSNPKKYVFGIENGKLLGYCCNYNWNKSKSNEDKGISESKDTQDNKGRPKFEWKNSSTWKILSKVSRVKFSILPSIEDTHKKKQYHPLEGSRKSLPKIEATPLVLTDASKTNYRGTTNDVYVGKSRSG